MTENSLAAVVPASPRRPFKLLFCRDNGIFCLSSVEERHIRLFYVFLPWNKDTFCFFMYFFHGRNTHSVVFYLSSVEEIHIRLFSVFLPWKKYTFNCFMSFCHGRNTHSIVLCLSSMEERHKTPLGVFPHV